MPIHDIIDNRQQKLVDQINCILTSSSSAHFAVGYFFLSGFTAIAEKLTNIKELRLLIGNTSNNKTIEQIAQGYRRLELIADKIEAQNYPKRTEVQQITNNTSANIRSSIELMDQTDAAEILVKNLVQMIAEKRLHVRVYTKGTLHAKAYIFDYGTVYDSQGRPLERTEKGIAIVGSSNLTLSGITHNTELNVMIHGNDNHTELTDSFNELWNEAEDFNAALMQEMQKSWAVASVSPYDVYMKTLYCLVKDRLEDTEPKDLILEDNKITKQLAEFQKVAVNHAVQNIRDYGGTFVSDVVGHGIRTAKFSLSSKGTFIFCEASDPNRPDIKGYQQLFLIDNNGKIISRDIPRILGAIKSDANAATYKLPENHNSVVMSIKYQFAEEVKHRQSERQYNQRLTQGQRYILRELRIFFKSLRDEDLKAQVNILESVFRSPLTQAIHRELNILRRNGLTGQNLFNQLVQIYRQHNMQEWNNNHLPVLSQPIPMIVCSQALV
ncbi:phospholipase D-like domain-containing protein [Anabaena sp. UHCC 0399]|uniref:phospholipase D-like domain-containing protein n=1 Tax=Anabaena sp. UHCC 0399 TaxID=3110238 RepID=UPI002B1EBFCA|nr:phospholipase D-like domain-containing protein [Anabaena sp. UHCC 0399]MEA5565782.1 phospholipase D-like domain-containing protein [Anabaena sp. UHCC 0399]